MDNVKASHGGLITDMRKLSVNVLQPVWPADYVRVTDDGRWMRCTVEEAEGIVLASGDPSAPVSIVTHAETVL